MFVLDTGLRNVTDEGLKAFSEAVGSSRSMTTVTLEGKRQQLGMLLRLPKGVHAILCVCVCCVVMSAC